jgi:hypothetical protein
MVRRVGWKKKITNRAKVARVGRLKSADISVPSILQDNRSPVHRRPARKAAPRSDAPGIPTKLTNRSQTCGSIPGSCDAMRRRLERPTDRDRSNSTNTTLFPEAGPVNDIKLESRLRRELNSIRSQFQLYLDNCPGIPGLTERTEARPTNRYIHPGTQTRH